MLPDSFSFIRLAGILLILVVSETAGRSAEAKRVLIIHSFVNAAPPFTTHSVAFETVLTTEMKSEVDLDEITLDVARYATPDMEEALVEYLLKRMEQWQPDLVVPVGSPAGVFVAQHRSQLFPSTPVIYTGMDQRRLPPGETRNNASFVGESFDFPAMMDEMLRLAPRTTNVAVVIGASQLERYWAEVIQREWAPYTHRVGFTWLNDLSFQQMLDQVSQLPPRSFIFLVLLMRDASGVTHNADEALSHIRNVANAPVNSIFQHQLGLGIVGGRLYQAELEGEEAGRIAIRVLRGESITNFPPMIIEPTEPRYDARELARWNIPESRLPPGSKVLFRQPSFWERYWGRILVVGMALLAQGIIISRLLTHRERQRRAKNALREISNRLQAILDTAVEGIMTIDEDGTLESVNGAGEKLFGYCASELLGRDVRLIMPFANDREPSGFLARFHPADKDRVIGVGREVTGQRKDGSTFPMELTVSEIHLAGCRVFTGFVRDITERKQAEQSAREFSGRLLRAQESERARLARELHDDITQRLARLAIDAARAGTEATDLSSDKYLRDVRDGLVQLSKDVHALSYQLHPSLLYELGLGEALQAECDRVSKNADVQVAIHLEEIPEKIPADAALCLFRVAQEALRNVVRHAQAKSAVVSLREMDRGLQLAVTDTGVGFDPVRHRQRPSLGLASMAERVHLVGGDLDVESAPGQGTTIVAWIPINGTES